MSKMAILIGVGVGIMYLILALVNPEKASTAARSGLWIMIDPKVSLLPLIFFILLLTGLIQTLIPREAIGSHLGEASGLRGYLLATGLGAVTPGGPIVAFPLAATLLRSGAAFGPVLTYITAWSLLGMSRIPIELPFVGSRFILTQYAVGVFFPTVIGMLGEKLYRFLA